MPGNLELLNMQGNVVAARMKKAAIVGLPNAGKSQVFNNLTGEYSVVANYPGTTFEMKRAKKLIQGQLYEIIDTPGLHCLSIHSEEEIVVRTLIFEEQPDLIIQCVEASHLDQSLMLAADLLELEIPMFIVINGMDEAGRKGIVVDSEQLARFLGVPVVEFDAFCGKGCHELKDSIVKASKGRISLNYGFGIESAITELAALLPFDLGFKHKIAFLLLLNDVYLEKYLIEKLGEKIVSPLLAEVRAFRRKFNNNIQSLVASRRRLWVDQAVCAAVKKKNIMPTEFAQHFAQACRHPVLGIPILLFMMACVYISVTYVSGFLDKILNSFLVRPVIGSITSLALPRFWEGLLIGTHGILTLGFFNAIGTVLPILSVFFFILGLFEDSGYIANFCVFSKRIFEKIGVTGKAIIPLVLGFGCKSMATLSTKGLSSYKEKFIAVFLIAFAVPCSAQLGINMAILAKVGVSAILIAFGTLAILGAAAGLILNTLIKEDEDSCFIQSLAPMRLPNLGAVWKKTYYRIVLFLKEAIPIFIISAAALYIFDKTGALDSIKRIFSPLMVSWMGLPSDIVDVFILALARREAAAGLIFNMVNAGRLSYIQSIVAVVVTTTFFPCFTNIIAIGKEMGIRAAVVMSGLICISSFVLAGALRWILVLAFGG